MTLIGSPRRGLRRREQFPARSCCPGCRPVLSRAVAGGPGHQTVHSLSVARGPRQPVRTLSGAVVQGCLFALKPLRGVQSGGVVFAALTCQFTHLLPRRVRAFLFSHSLSREGPGGNYPLLVSCLHKGTSATESFRSSVCVAAKGDSDHIHHHFQGDTCSLLLPCLETEGSGLDPQSDPTQLCRLVDESTLTARSFRRAKRQSLNARFSLLRRQSAADSARLVDYIASPAETHRVWGSAAAMIWLHVPLFCLSDITSNITQSNKYYTISHILLM